jgi:DNA mismatch repair protein MutS2
VRLGRLRVRVRLEDLRVPAVEDGGEQQPGARRPSRRVRQALAEAQPAPEAFTPGESPGLELDLRGKTVDEALAALARYLDAAFRAGLPWVRVIHGKGTGALRQAVRAELQGHPLVHGFESGKENEGGDGVTVVRLLPLE